MATPWSNLPPLDEAFLEDFKLQASPEEGQQKEKKRRKKEKRKKNSKIEKPKDVGHFLVQKLKILISVHARAKMS